MCVCGRGVDHMEGSKQHYVQSTSPWHGRSMTESLRSFPPASRLGMDSFILKFIHLMWHCELLIEQWFLPKKVCVCELEHLLVMVDLPASWKSIEHFLLWQAVMNELNNDNMIEIDRLRLVMLYALRFEKENPQQLELLVSKMASRSNVYKPGVILLTAFIWVYAPKFQFLY